MPWKKVCSLNELEQNQIMEFDVDGTPVAVVRGDNQTVVIPPMCPHLEEPLSQGICDGQTLTCHKHLWQWNLKTGEPLGLAQKPLKRYDSKVEGELLFALIDQEILYDYE